MKKLICIIAIVGIMFLHAMPALAGDVPESMFEDRALLFFGEVVSYDENYKTITVLPIEKIKGDVEIGIEQTYEESVLVGESFLLSEEKTYLMSFYDHNNPLYVLCVTSTDTKTLKIEGISEFNMFERMQKYLNDGTYAEKEDERLLRLSELTSTHSTTLGSEYSLPEKTSAISELATKSMSANLVERDTNYWWHGLVGISVVVISAGIIIYLRNKNR